MLDISTAPSALCAPLQQICSLVLALLDTFCPAKQTFHNKEQPGAQVYPNRIRERSLKNSRPKLKSQSAILVKGSHFVQVSSNQKQVSENMQSENKVPESSRADRREVWVDPSIATGVWERGTGSWPSWGDTAILALTRGHIPADDLQWEVASKTKACPFRQERILAPPSSFTD